MNYKIIKNLLPENDSRTFGYMKARTVVIHNTANDASAQSEANYVHSKKSDVTYHYAIDDIEAVQILPHIKSGWHAGDGGKTDGGRYGIGIEICYSKSGGARYDKAEDNAAHLAAQILKQEGLPLSALSKHQDWSGKYCPHRILSRNGWTGFKNKVEKYYKEDDMKPKFGIFALNEADYPAIEEILSSVVGSAKFDWKKTPVEMFEKVVQVGGAKQRAEYIHLAGTNRTETIAKVREWIARNK